MSPSKFLFCDMKIIFQYNMIAVETQKDDDDRLFCHLLMFSGNSVRLKTL
jgi:hypothetical protein